MLRDIFGLLLAVIVIGLALSLAMDAAGMIDVISLGREIMTDGWSLAGAFAPRVCRRTHAMAA